jgi:hypothetical protein
MTILSGWREQYDRVLRSHARLVQMADGQIMASSDEARDALFHFFQDAYHLKDWVKNDPTVQTGSVETFVSGEVSLRFCADLCNGTKHFGLKPKKNQPPRTGDPSTAFTSESVTVRPATVGTGRLPRPALHYWAAESGGQQYDAVTLAGDVVRTWEQWLRGENLLP